MDAVRDRLGRLVSALYLAMCLRCGPSSVVQAEEVGPSRARSVNIRNLRGPCSYADIRRLGVCGLDARGVELSLDLYPGVRYCNDTDDQDGKPVETSWSRECHSG
jgi:hypothetical protein